MNYKYNYISTNQQYTRKKARGALKCFSLISKDFIMNKDKFLISILFSVFSKFNTNQCVKTTCHSYFYCDISCWMVLLFLIKLTWLDLLLWIEILFSCTINVICRNSLLKNDLILNWKLDRFKIAENVQNLSATYNENIVIKLIWNC